MRMASGAQSLPIPALRDSDKDAGRIKLDVNKSKPVTLIIDRVFQGLFSGPSNLFDHDVVRQSSSAPVARGAATRETLLSEC
jgi:hypothetical protein